MIDLLAAQRQMYRDAKRLQRIQLLASVGLALLAPLLVLWWNDASSTLGAVAAVVLIANRAVLGPWAVRRRQRAVAVQEEFDTYVLNLPRVAGISPTSPQVVAAAARRYLHRSGPRGREELRRWYPDTGRLPHPFDALVCQRAGLSWTARLHSEWSWVILLSVAAWFIIGVVVAIWQDLTLGTYLAQLFLPSAPAFVEALDRRDQHAQRATRVGSAEDMAASAWEDGLNAKHLSVAACRQVQDSIREVRAIPADVPDLYYKKRRPDFEADMQSACDHLISEAESRGVI